MEDKVRETDRIGFVFILVGFMLLSAITGYVFGNAEGRNKVIDQAIKNKAAIWVADPVTGKTSLIWVGKGE